MASTAAQLALFRLRGPEFADGEPYGLTDSEVATLLDSIVTWMNPATLGVRFDEAVVLYALHTLTMQTRNVQAGGAGGPTTALTGERAGRVAKTYGQPGAFGRTTGLDLTPYGLEYQRILKSRPLLRHFTTHPNFPMSG